LSRDKPDGRDEHADVRRLQRGQRPKHLLLALETGHFTVPARGLVDYEIAAIDATWSGLCFARRKAKS